MSSKLQNIIDMLCDGRCQTLDELQNAANLSIWQIEATVAFLVKFGFAEINRGIEVKISEAAKKLLAQTF